MLFANGSNLFFSLCLVKNLLFTDQCHEEHHFYYVAPDDQILQTYCASEVAISSLYFEPRCTSLFVGLSFGHFQIVDLKDLLLR